MIDLAALQKNLVIARKTVKAATSRKLSLRRQYDSAFQAENRAKESVTAAIDALHNANNDLINE